MNHIYLDKIVDDIKIYISTDTEYLRKKSHEGNPVILLINNENRFEDTSFSKYAIEIEEYDSDAYDKEGNYTFLPNNQMSVDEIKEVVTDSYCKIAIAREYGNPLEIVKTDRLVIREISKDDAIEIINMYNSGSVPFLEDFFSDVDEGIAYIEKYTSEVYAFYNFGIWGIFDKITGEFIGLGGVSPRENKEENAYLINLELGYAICEKYRRCGYAYEACQAIIDYAKKNIEHNYIYVNINPDNIAAINLAKKLGLVK